VNRQIAQIGQVRHRRLIAAGLAFGQQPWQLRPDLLLALGQRIELGQPGTLSRLLLARLALLPHTSAAAPIALKLRRAAPEAAGRCAPPPRAAAAAAPRRLARHALARTSRLLRSSSGSSGTQRSIGSVVAFSAGLAVAAAPTRSWSMSKNSANARSGALSCPRPGGTGGSSARRRRQQHPLPRRPTRRFIAHAG